MGLFHGKAQRNREKTAAEIAEEQAETAAERPKEQARTVKVAPREPKYEARPDPDKPGWGLTMGQEIFKVREDRASHE